MPLSSTAPAGRQADVPADQPPFKEDQVRAVSLGDGAEATSGWGVAGVLRAASQARV